MFGFNNYTTDQERLKAFVKAVDELLSTTIKSGSWELSEPSLKTKLRLDTEVLDAARAALDEFHQQQQIQKIVTSIDQASTSVLSSHGLNGAQLQFKLKNVEHRERRFRFRPLAGPLRRLVQAIDTLLDSILDALHIGKALKELKDGVFDATEDQRGWRS